MSFLISLLIMFLGKNSDDASEQMNDVLTQVATNTETTKNAGNAILYECVQTIMETDGDSGLRVLAVNILGRFLLNRDNNIRYVALNSLSKVIVEDISAVQRHTNTIVECLKDDDISIRQRALEIIYQLVNDQNVVFLTAELLNYLIIAHIDHKVSLVSQIMKLVEKYSPTKKWRMDTVLTMLSLSGNEIEESVLNTAIVFIAQSEGLQGYAVHRLFRILQDNTSQQGLLHVAIWCIGEYSDLIVRHCPPTDSDGEAYTAGIIN
jgi:AP-1 complex subunit gamma-1